MPREAPPDVTCTDNSNRKPQASAPEPVSLIFHLFRASHQHTPATALANAPKNFFRLLSPSTRRVAAPIISPIKSPAHTHEHIAADRAPNGAPDCSHRWSKAQRSKPCATGGQRHGRNPAPVGAEEPLECPQKTTQNSTRPNSRPPQALAQSPRGLCHRMSPSIRCLREGPRRGLPFGDGLPATHDSPCVTVFAFILDSSAPLCHLPDSFFKDLQTNFPEIFHSHSGTHRSCFILPFFTKNRPIRASPQPMPATSVATIPEGLVSPYVTFSFSRLARDQRPCLHPGPLGPSTPWPLFFRLLSPTIWSPADMPMYHLDRLTTGVP